MGRGVKAEKTKPKSILLLSSIESEASERRDLTVPTEDEHDGGQDCRLAGPVLSGQEGQPLVGCEGEFLQQNIM